MESLLERLADLDSSGYYALGVPAYLLLLFVERALARRRGLTTSGFGRAVGNMSAGLGAIMIGLFLGPLLIRLYLWGFEHLALIRWESGSWVPWVLAFALGDLGYYLNHRAGHRFGVLWAVHGVHHQCDELDFTIAMRHPWFSDVYAPLFYAALPICGVPAGHFFFAISMISFYAFFVHTRTYDFPSLGVLVTPGTHVVHHAKNPRYLGKNLGAMFCVWDKLFGTHAVVDPAEPPVLGTPDGYRTHNGARVQWAHFAELWRSLRGAASWADRLRLLVAPPGWRPPGVARRARQEARPESDLSPALKAYVGVQFGATALLAVFVLWLRARHALSIQVVGVALVLFSTATLGQLLDGTQAARRDEAARLLATGALSLWIATLPGYHAPGLALLAVACTGGAWLARARFEQASARPGEREVRTRERRSS